MVFTDGAQPSVLAHIGFLVSRLYEWIHGAVRCQIEIGSLFHYTSSCTIPFSRGDGDWDSSDFFLSVSIQLSCHLGVIVAEGCFLIHLGHDRWISETKSED
jgi:hypothetical protein